MMTVNVTFPGGDTIAEACEQAQSFAFQHECCVEFMFNGVRMYVSPGDEIKDLVAEYQLKSC